MHRNKFLYNKTNHMHQFHKFTLAWNSTCFGQFLCPSSGVYSLYTQQWYMLYRFVDSCRAGPGWTRVPSWSCSTVVYKPVWHIFTYIHLFTAHSAMVYVIRVCRQLQNRTRIDQSSILVLLYSCLQTCMTYTIAECTVNKLLMMDRVTVRNM